MAERTCITTRQTLSPHRLIRFVAAPDGSSWVLRRSLSCPINVTEAMLRRSTIKGHAATCCLSVNIERNLALWMHLPRKAFIQPQDLFFQQRDG